jgi:hypothetical protein
VKDVILSGLEGPGSSTNSKYCCQCHTLLTKDNDSGWEIFVAPTVSGPICVMCDLEYAPKDGTKVEG